MDGFGHLYFDNVSQKPSTFGSAPTLNSHRKEVSDRGSGSTSSDLR